MSKLAQNLQPGDRLSLTGAEILAVSRVGSRIGVAMASGSPKSFAIGQTVYLQG